MSDLVWDKLLRLKDCVCSMFEECDLQPVCFCGILPGVGIAYNYIHTDSCEDTDGMAWVQLVNQFPTNRFPQSSAGPQKCGVEIGVNVQVGVIRSLPVGDGLDVPDAATMQAVAEQQMEEAAAIRKAILCCFSAGVILGTYVPVGPSGGAVGGYWNAAIPTEEPDDD